MKRCSTCNRTFAEPNLTFCTEDGTPLIEVDPAADDGEATIVSAQAAPKQSSSESGWIEPDYRPPGQFGSAPVPSQRTAWPWFIGMLVVVLLAFVGLGIAAAIFVPDIMKARRARNESTSPPVNSQPNENSNRNANGNANANSNAGMANESGNANANTNVSVNTPAPENQELVLADLRKIEDAWTVANLNADREKLATILADDYVGTQDGVMQGKAEYLRDIKPDPAVKHWDFRNLKVVLRGNRATLTGLVRLASDEQDEELLLNFIDKFVWRDGRWQAVASEIAKVQ
jgi:Domain of unknown function (DUF4440)